MDCILVIADGKTERVDFYVRQDTVRAREVIALDDSIDRIAEWVIFSVTGTKGDSSAVLPESPIYATIE